MKLYGTTQKIELSVNGTKVKIVDGFVNGEDLSSSQRWLVISEDNYGAIPAFRIKVPAKWELGQPYETTVSVKHPTRGTYSTDVHRGKTIEGNFYGENIEVKVLTRNWVCQTHQLNNRGLMNPTAEQVLQFEADGQPIDCTAQVRPLTELPTEIAVKPSTTEEKQAELDFYINEACEWLGVDRATADVVVGGKKNAGKKATKPTVPQEWVDTLAQVHELKNAYDLEKVLKAQGLVEPFVDRFYGAWADKKFAAPKLKMKDGVWCVGERYNGGTKIDQAIIDACNAWLAANPDAPRKTAKKTAAKKA